MTTQVTNSVIVALLPWIGLLVLALLMARILVWCSRAKLNLRRAPQLHRCQEGSVQSLSFVLTLPFFLMILMLIIQVSQIMIANVVVHVAAFNSARAAVVWIPANTEFTETANRISNFSAIQRTAEGTQYRVFPNSDSSKYSRIKQAAVLACTPLAPSRSLGYGMDTNVQLSSLALSKLYAGLDADSLTNTLISTRLQNKFAYSDANTAVDVTFWHRVGPFPNYQDPPLQVTYDVFPYRDEYYSNEIGWQDEVTTTVTHNLALLPGPVRLFSRNVSTDATNQTYTFPVVAAATMINEGEKPLLFHWQEGMQ